MNSHFLHNCDKITVWQGLEHRKQTNAPHLQYKLETKEKKQKTKTKWVSSQLGQSHASLSLLASLKAVLR